MSWPFFTGEKPQAEKLGQFGPYNPALSASVADPNLGDNGSAGGYFQRVGPRLVWFEARFTLAGDGMSFGSGDWLVSLPVTLDTGAVPANSFLLEGATAGAGVIMRISPAGSAPRIVPLSLQAHSSTQARFHVPIVSSTAPNDTTLRAASSVFTSATEVRMRFSGMYPCVPQG